MTDYMYMIPGSFSCPDITCMSGFAILYLLEAARYLVLSVSSVQESPAWSEVLG